MNSKMHYVHGLDTGMDASTESILPLILYIGLALNSFRQGFLVDRSLFLRVALFYSIFNTGAGITKLDFLLNQKTCKI